jgi:hypothetical protein
VKTIVLLALALSACVLSEEPCRDPQSIDFSVVERTSDCEPEMDVRKGVLNCQQISGDLDRSTCEFRGVAACTDGVRATVYVNVEPGERAHGRATYRRPSDGCTVELELLEPR